MPQYSIAEAKNGLPKLVREAEAGNDIELTRRGKPVAMVVGTRRYERLTANRSSFWESYQQFRQQHDLVALDLDPSEIFDRDRDPSTGRDFTW